MNRWFNLRRRANRANAGNAAGFTLVELLVVLAILGLLAAIVAPQALKYLGTAKTKTTKLQIDGIVAALNLYRLDVGHYPTEQEGLGSLVTAPPNASRWNGPYVETKEKLNDPWGFAYHFKNPGEHGEIDLYSLGSDNAAGGTGEQQDVTSW